ncbi:hypothetical protein MIMGU_mgv1a018743mg, partial [Erythranthe guttata]
DLEKVIQDIDFIKKDVMKIKEKNIGIIEDRLDLNSSTRGGSSSSPLTTKQIAVVGLDDQLIEVMDKRTGQQSNLRLIPIVGMGGIGKTTLAINAYRNPLITEQFDIRSWVTISQTYNVREILVEILLCERVHKSLWRKRYLIVMDDIWSVEVWDKVQLFFPDNGQGSRVMITTRLSNIVFQLIGSHGLVMDLLDVDKSWDLLYGSIFGKEEDCPVELEEIGKKIAKNCKGLPLSIVVIGGLLAKGKSLEVVSREYLKDLCDRNLIRAHQRGTNGGIKFCTIHDLVRELCLREAEKEKFLYVRRQHDLNNPQGIINTQRRICIHHSTTQKKYLPAALHALQYVPLARSLFFKFEGVLPSLDHCRLLRILRAVDTYLNFDGQNIHCMYTLEDVFQLVNSWYLAVEDFRDENLCKFPSSVYLLWNLQALIVESLVGVVVAPSEIWKMTQLRHVQFSSGLEMHDPPLGRQDDEFVLGNLQTLSLILNFKCGEEVVKRIPNINRLKIFYRGEEIEGYLSIGWLPNLEVLKLKYNSFVRAERETVEGQFCNLRFLLISMSTDLEWWTTDSNHFPRLEQLELLRLNKLKEIPSCIGEIPMLGSIVLNYCSQSAVVSAKEILDEQKDLGNTRDFSARLKCKKPNYT